MPFMRYCPWCHTKVRAPWKIRRHKRHLRQMRLGRAARVLDPLPVVYGQAVSDGLALSGRFPASPTAHSAICCTSSRWPPSACTVSGRSWTRPERTAVSPNFSSSDVSHSRTDRAGTGMWPTLTARLMSSSLTRGRTSTRTRPLPSDTGKTSTCVPYLRNAIDVSCRLWPARDRETRRRRSATPVGRWSSQWRAPPTPSPHCATPVLR